MEYLVIFLSLIVILLVTILVVMFVTKRMKKWKCREGNCELTLEDGQYATKSECLKSCVKEKDAWACNSNYQCVKAEQGFTSKELCQQNCKRPTPTLGYYYYPQSLYYYPRPFYGRRRWWRRRRPWRHGKKGSK